MECLQGHREKDSINPLYYYVFPLRPPGKKQGHQSGNRESNSPPLSFFPATTPAVSRTKYPLFFSLCNGSQLFFPLSRTSIGITPLNLRCSCPSAIPTAASTRPSSATPAANPPSSSPKTSQPSPNPSSAALPSYSPPEISGNRGIFPGRLCLLWLLPPHTQQ